MSTSPNAARGPRPPRRSALRTLATATLETLTAAGLDDFGTGYGPGTCLVFSYAGHVPDGDAAPQPSSFCFG